MTALIRGGKDGFLRYAISGGGTTQYITLSLRPPTRSTALLNET